jgi:hypothetical protein
MLLQTKRDASVNCFWPFLHPTRSSLVQHTVLKFPSPSAAKVFRLQLNRFPVRRSLRCVLPGLVVLRQSLRRGRAFFGDHAFEGREPMTIVGFAGVGIAGGLCLFDLLTEHCGPLAPGEQTFLIERQRHGERVGFPGRAKHRAVLVAGDAWKSFGGAAGGLRFDGRGFRHVRYGDRVIELAIV